MAEVFRAKAFGVEGFERLVAVKRILPNIAEDEEFITMFIDEAKIAVQLNHANIAQIFDLGKVDGATSSPSSTSTARTFAAIFDRCRQPRRADADPAGLLRASMKVCEGLDYAHNKRDHERPRAGPRAPGRSPAERAHLLRGRGEADRLRHRQGGRQGPPRPRPASSRASSATCRPSRCAGCRSTARSTSSPCGIVLYELLTGERLFVGRATSRRSRRCATSRSCRPRTYNRKIPDELERIVLKALAKDVEDRYQNAIDLHDELQAFVYTAGEFYSRKDLAAYVKNAFPESDLNPGAGVGLGSGTGRRKPTAFARVGPSRITARGAQSRWAGPGAGSGRQRPLSTSFVAPSAVRASAPPRPPRTSAGLRNLLVRFPWRLVRRPASRT